MSKFIDSIIEHEGVKGNQTPFRITDPKMRKWVSMFDKTNKIELDPNAKKAPGTENFLYTKRPEDVKPAVAEQFRLYAEREPGITVERAVRKFDQTGADGKLKFLEGRGISRKARLQDLNDDGQIDGKDMARQFKAMKGINDAPLEQGRPNTAAEAEWD